MVVKECNHLVFCPKACAWVLYSPSKPNPDRNAQGLPDTKVGTFTQALYDEAKKNGWTVISMKDDWKRIFPFEP